MIYDIIVVGAGPAGLTAALYAARAEKNVLVFEREVVGGQVTHSPKIENYPGYIKMSGLEFAEQLSAQVTSHGVEIVDAEVEKLERNGNIWNVEASGKKYEAYAVILATGAKHRTLGLEREDELEGMGVSYCAVCDGAFYRGQTVAIIGGGNSALQEAELLSDICKKVYLIQNLDFFTGEGILLNKLKQRNNVEMITGKVVKELVGEDELTAIVIAPSENSADKTVMEQTVEVNGMFVAIGLKPENENFADVAKLNEYGYIVADEGCTIGDGLFTAGDCRTKAIRQITTATADGATAALSACRYLNTIAK